MKYSSNQNIEKATRLVEYLIKLASLRIKIIREIKEYEQVLWMQEIPKEKGCFTQAWGPNPEYDEDVWIEIQLPKEVELPVPPSICNEWLDKNSLLKTNSIPELLESITLRKKNPLWKDGSNIPEYIEEVLQLENQLEVKKAWATYIEQKWNPWAAQHNKWENIYLVYSKLFLINQAQLKLGEEYELILGLGLLSWETPDNQRIKRHLIVANASLEFEAALGKFTVRIHQDGANLRPEFDMLDLDQKPARLEDTVKTLLKKAADNPWDKGNIENTLCSIARLLHPKCEFYPSLSSNKFDLSKKPCIEWAPALFLRKRSTKGLIDILSRIKERIINEGEIPSEFADLAEIENINKLEFSSNQSSETDASIPELFFPKPYNEEQRRIIDKLNASNSVLVQGPPGTGKSHTIANLVCHLLATNQKILVTAKTPRALKVLEGLLPEELRPLCVILIGSGVEERKSLEASVNGINIKKEQWNEIQAKKEIKKVENSLIQNKKEKAQIENRLRTIREAETYSQSVGEGEYQGTAAQIAKKIVKDESKYVWFLDRIPYNKPNPFADIDLIRFIKNLRKLSSEKYKEVNKIWPKPIPSMDIIQDLFEKELNASELEKESVLDKNDKSFERILSLTQEAIVSIKEQFAIFVEKIENLKLKNIKWISNALRDTLSGNTGVLKEISYTCEQIIKKIDKIVQKADANVIVLSDRYNEKATLDDALILKRHLLSGGKLGWGPFRPRIVKPLKYILTEVRLNGHLCNDLNRISELIDVLNVHIEIERGWNCWIGRVEREKGPYIIQFSNLQSHASILFSILSLENQLIKCKEVLNKFGNPINPIWYEESSLYSVVKNCNFALARKNLLDIKKAIQEYEMKFLSAASHPNAHQIARTILQTIRERNLEAYVRCHKKIIQLENEKTLAIWINSTIETIRAHTPELIKCILRDITNLEWSTRLKLIPEAWRWAQVRSWLYEYLNKDDIHSLTQRYGQLENEIMKGITKIASLRAWSFCFNIMNDEHQRHMTAWQQEMRKFGKGTGKHAPRHRREAQKHLNQCRNAVPAWVMPLHRIWDTVDPMPGMFDVIIVDEASQCGCESLPLLYIGKKILIVGDDKQISPEAVGIQRNPVFSLQNQYLYDFKFKSSFDVEQSLFEQGKLRCGTQHITLREHFRCMPEIIRFSNDLFYSDTPLIPLRQYPPDRLAPLAHVYIEDGYREGSESKVVNRPEAEAIVNKIKELCQDKKYDNKTMGVIVLQGELQAGIIEGQLLEQIGAEEIEKRRLICGDSYSFQGDERDIIFLSMVAAPNERIGPLTKGSDERRFNVAASRARDQIWLFHSVKRTDLSESCLRRKLLEYFEQSKEKEIAGIKIDDLQKKTYNQNRSCVEPPIPFESWFEVDVALEIAKKNYHVIPQFEVSGKRIDLVIEGGKTRLAVECDGDAFHGAEEYERDMNRQRILERCGWVFFRIRASSFYGAKNDVLNSLWQKLEERGIYPAS